jgi:hypothetical protein
VIDTTLQNLGCFLHTERSFFSQFSEDGNHLVFTNTWAAEGLSPRSQIFKLEVEQLKFEDLISELSATFINIKASEIDKNIERGLQKCYRECHDYE